MRTITLTMLALVSLSGVAFAQQNRNHAAVKATRIEKVLDANPEPDGKAYRIELQLKRGRRVAYEIPPPEASKIADGLSKPAVAGGQKQRVATLVYGISIQADAKGQAVILTPRGRSGPLEALAIPLSGADQFLEVLRAKIAEAKANAAKQAKPPTKPEQAAPSK